MYRYDYSSLHPVALDRAVRLQDAAEARRLARAGRRAVRQRGLSRAVRAQVRSRR